MVGFERHGKPTMMERPASRAEPVVKSVLDESVRELELARGPFTNERGSCGRLDVVENRRLIELQRSRDDTGVEVATRDGCQLEDASRFGSESAETGLDDRSDRARQLQASEVDVAAPATLGIRGHRAGLDEVAYEFNREQRVAVGLLVEVGRDRLCLFSEVVPRSGFEQCGKAVAAQTVDCEVAHRREGT